MVNGYRAEITFNPEWTAYSFKLFDKKEDAEAYIKLQLAHEEKMLGKKGYSRVEEVELERCPHRWCHNWMEAGDRECISCDHIRGDCL